MHGAKTRLAVSYTQNIKDMYQPSFYEYLSYQVEDFVMDDAFQQWIRHPDPVSNQFWKQFLNVYPEKREQLEEAGEMVRSIHFKPHTLSKEKQESILHKVYEQAAKSAPENTPISLPPFNQKYMAVAASISLLLFSFVAFWFYSSAYETYETGYQESATIQLSDGSEVSLNANTRLKVRMDMDANEPREVWLDGEAYFHVQRLDGEHAKKLPRLKNFIVHTDNLDVEVLGTTFNVSSRSKKSEVLLKSGKVKVASQQIDQPQILQPGDFLTLSGEDRSFQLKKAETEADLAWRDNYFIFENTTLRQVARAIEDYYGVEVKIANQQLADKIFTARISRDELPMLLKAIEASFGVRVSTEKGRITIQP